MMPFQYDRPVFVKIAFNARNRDWKIQEHYPWRELSSDVNNVQMLYNNGYLYHNGELEDKAKVGDGLEALDVDALAKVVDSINDKVKAKTTSKAEFDRLKCKKSRILDKQRGLIRSWRRTHGKLEND